MPTIDVTTLNIVLENSDPTNIISAPVGTYFYRNGNYFTLLNDSAGTLPSLMIYNKFLGYYRTQPWFTSLDISKLTYANPKEIWFKKTGTGSTGWVFISNGDINSVYN